HHAGIRVPARRPPADELPPAAVDAARARDGVLGDRADAAPLPDRDRGALPVLFLRRRHAHPLTLWTRRHASVPGGCRRRWPLPPRLAGAVSPALRTGPLQGFSVRVAPAPSALWMVRHASVTAAAARHDRVRRVCEGRGGSRGRAEDAARRRP